MEFAFEDTKTYVLTELGSQFVHYTMNELVDICRDKDNNQICSSPNILAGTSRDETDRRTDVIQITYSLSDLA
jgi:hypothetical protein